MTPSAPRPTGPRAALAAALVALGLLVLGAGPAAAHNTLRSTDPADGSTVTTAPAQVTLTFDQAALEIGTTIVVTGPDGSPVSEGAAQLVDTSVVQPLAATLPAGAYTVDWRVTSADGHPLSGTFTFTATEAVGAPAPEPEPTEPTEPTEPDEPAVIAEPTAEGSASPDVTATADEDDASPLSGGVAAALAAAAVLAAAGVAAALVVSRRRGLHGTDGADAPDDGTGPREG